MALRQPHDRTCLRLRDLDAVEVGGAPGAAVSWTSLFVSSLETEKLPMGAKGEVRFGFSWSV